MRSCSTRSCRRTRWRPSSSSRCRARVDTSCPRPAFCGPAGAVRPARHPAHRRRDPVGRRAHRQDVGHRALRRGAGHPAVGQGHRLGHAPLGDGREARTSSKPGTGALTARPTAVTRSPAPPPSAPSSCCRMGSSRTPQRVAPRASPGCRRCVPGTPTAVVDVRGLGLMLALEMATPQLADALEYEAFTRGLLVLGCGAKSVRISPPLVIDEATMASGLQVLEELDRCRPPQLDGSRCLHRQAGRPHCRARALGLDTHRGPASTGLFGLPIVHSYGPDRFPDAPALRFR